MKIKFNKLHVDAITPTQSSAGSAGLDLHTIEHATIPAGCRAMLKTGIALELHENTVGLIWPRSKLAAKKGIDVLAGVVDNDYRGEVMISLLNTSDQAVEFKCGDKVAQMIIQEYKKVEFVQSPLSETGRGNAGINSTEMRL
jgi:dUTP pyrophosphatase